MNQTIEDSKARGIMVGGNTIPLEDGKIEMPPEDAKQTNQILDFIFNGGYQEIKIGDCKAEDILSKEQIKELQKNRQERKTVKALERELASQR